MEKPIKRSVDICVGHSLQTRQMQFYNPAEIDAYIAHLAQRAEAAEARLEDLEKQEPVGTVSIAMDWNTHRSIEKAQIK